MAAAGPLVWMKLDERGRQYVLEHLENINTLCRELWRVVSNEPGEVITLAPAKTPRDRLYQFEWGDLVPGNIENIDAARAAAHGHSFMAAVVSLHREQTDWLWVELAKTAGGSCLIDDVNPTWSDVVTRPYFAQMPRSFGVGEEVYHVVQERHGIQALTEDLASGDALWHAVAAICGTTPVVADRTSTEDEIKETAATVIALTCRAYDGEGFVAWRRK